LVIKKLGSNITLVYSIPTIPATILASFAVKNQTCYTISMAKKIIPPESVKQLPKTVIKQMTALATSGFGLVAALAVFVTLQLSKLEQKLNS